MRSMTVCDRTFSDQPGRGLRRGRLPLASMPLVLLMLGLLSMSACSKDREESTQEQTENKAGRTADPPKMSGDRFSSDLRVRIFIIREAGGELEIIGDMPSASPLDIPQCWSWGIYVRHRVDMKALAREIAAKKVPLLRIDGVVDGDLADIKGLTGLRELHLVGRKITDAGLAHLKGLTALRKLGLAFTKITDAGLAHLEGLTGLRELYLSDTKITDAGLSHLKGLTGLWKLDLRDTQITDAGLADLKKALPNTHIHSY